MSQLGVEVPLKVSQDDPKTFPPFGLKQLNAATSVHHFSCQVKGRIDSKSRSII